MELLPSVAPVQVATFAHCSLHLALQSLFAGQLHENVPNQPCGSIPLASLDESLFGKRDPCNIGSKKKRI